MSEGTCQIPCQMPYPKKKTWKQRIRELKARWFGDYYKNFCPNCHPTEMILIHKEEYGKFSTYECPKCKKKKYKLLPKEAPEQ